MVRKLLFILTLFLCSCRTIQYVPVETIRVEYRDKFLRDSITLYDSIYIRETGDTVWKERYKFIYRDKLVRDSVFMSDTIKVPYPVKVVKEVKAPLAWWQKSLIFVGIISILCFIIFLVFRFKPSR